MQIPKQMTVMEKLQILSDAAKYDVACTSSGVDRKGNGHGMGNCIAPGICHTFSGDGRCVSLLKILFTNECIFNCSYCQNNCMNDIPRASFTPDEVCSLTMEFYRRNYIEGLFLSSGILVSPNYTMELIYQTLYQLRIKHHFNGYIHVKAIPGADPALIERTGFLADRMSINLELPTSDSLHTLAPCKSRRTILTPMRQIQNGIRNDRLLLSDGASSTDASSAGSVFPPAVSAGPRMDLSAPSSRFVPAGQSTQMIIGATKENDYQLLSTSQLLYQQYDLKRVFYSAYIPVNEDSALPSRETKPPLLREHRLYQADWLLRFYGFQADELLDEAHPNFHAQLDPKCDWALRHMELFPVEINTAEYADLLRVPGIGPKSAMRIVKSRRSSHLSFEHLKKIGVVLKRAKYFITCEGKMMYHMRLEQQFLTRQLTGEEAASNWEVSHPEQYQQLSLFDAAVPGHI